MENIQQTPNRIAFSSTVDENQNVLITTFKTSPKGPADEMPKKKSSKKKRANKKAIRQRNRLDSQSTEHDSDAALQPRSRQVNEQVGSSYNLIEFHGDSQSESNTENSISLNQNNSEFSTAGISVQQIPKKVIFVIPEEWAASIEIVKFPLSSGLNALENVSASVPPTYEQNSNFLGPIRSKGKSYSRSNRNTPYYFSRRDKHNGYASPNNSESIIFPTIKNEPISENFEFKRYYETRDYQTNEQTSNSIRPMRQKNNRKHFYTPYSNPAHERINNISLDSAGVSSASSYSRSGSRWHHSTRKEYSNTRKPRLCWNCHREGHIRINCPSFQRY